MVYYGYIKDTDLHENTDTNVYWSFSRYNEDGNMSEYNGIESKINYDDKNIVIIGDNIAFSEWVNEFKPETTN